MPRAAGAPAQQTQLNLHSTNHALLAQQDIAASVYQPDTLESRAIGVYKETARRARDGLLQHVSLPGDLRVR